MTLKGPTWNLKFICAALILKYIEYFTNDLKQTQVIPFGFSKSAVK